MTVNLICGSAESRRSCWSTTDTLTAGETFLSSLRPIQCVTQSLTGPAVVPVVPAVVYMMQHFDFSPPSHQAGRANQLSESCTAGRREKEVSPPLIHLLKSVPDHLAPAQSGTSCRPTTARPVQQNTQTGSSGEQKTSCPAAKFTTWSSYNCLIH